jgi:hypothetical protein
MRASGESTTPILPVTAARETVDDDGEDGMVLLRSW